MLVFLAIPILLRLLWGLDDLAATARCRCSSWCCSCLLRPPCQARRMHETGERVDCEPCSLMKACAVLHGAGTKLLQARNTSQSCHGGMGHEPSHMAAKATTD